MAQQIAGYSLGPIIIEGKTKVVYELPAHPEWCLLQNKDRITAGDGVKSHALAGKAAISNATNGKVFQILHAAGLDSAYVKQVSDTAFISKRCEMIPIECVTRRIATGSYLKRNVGVEEGFRFAPIKYETFFKDDANHDPQWSEEQILAAGFVFNGVKIGEVQVEIMQRTSVAIFEILEKAWATRNCSLIDMKIEFGIDQLGNVIVADVIDSDSWRLWPSGDKRLMKDKQVYRNLATVEQADLATIKSNFQWVSDQLDNIVQRPEHRIVIVMGSASDTDHCDRIRKHAEALGLRVDLQISSAHKATEATLRIAKRYESLGIPLVFVAVAGRSNGLGPVLSGNTAYPVINCPPVSAQNVTQDVWSSLNVPSGLGCGTVVYPEAAALLAAQIIGLGDFVVWSKLLVRQLRNLTGLLLANQAQQEKK